MADAGSETKLAPSRPATSPKRSPIGASAAPAAVELAVAAGAAESPATAALAPAAQPPKQASTDGATRAFAAMSLFQVAKGEYDKLDQADAERGYQCTAAQREALHAKYAGKALALARNQGGVYVKAAQFVASLQGGSGGGGVPAAYIATLASLTDRNMPHDLSLLEPLIQEELGRTDWLSPAGGVFAAVETPAIAAASLSQVHWATMADGTSVALKLQFPWLAKQVHTHTRTHARTHTHIHTHPPTHPHIDIDIDV